MIEKNPAAVAWTVIWISFGIFCAIWLGIFLSLQWYFTNATDSHSARVTIIRGTVWVQEPGQTGWDAATQDRELKEGSSLRTVETSEALVTLFDKSVVTLLPNTEIRLAGLRVAKFDPHRYFLTFFQKSGQTHIGVAPQPKGEKVFRFESPNSSATLHQGKYNITVNQDGTEVRVQNEGRALVMAQTRWVEVGQGEHTLVPLGAAPQDPRSTRAELIKNSDFSEGLAGWQSGNFIGFVEGQDIEGQVSTTVDQGKPAVRFFRQGSKGTHCETWLFQQINRDVTNSERLTLSIQFKLLNQNLSGGGYEGSEYPLLVRLNFRTANGPDFRVYGFYYQNKDRNRTDNGIQVSQDALVEYTVPENLMSIAPQPREITSIQVSASGWDYESLVTKVSLTAE